MKTITHRWDRWLIIFTITETAIVNRVLVHRVIPDTPARQVKSVRTSFRIVEVLQEHGTLTLNELAEYLDLAKSTIHNYLRTLESLGYVVTLGRSYRLGLRFLTHGMSARNTVREQDAVLHGLSQANDEIPETVWWIVEELGRGIFAANSAPRHGKQTYGQVGKRSYLHTHAPGKAILAECTDDYVERVIDYHGLPAHTSETITTIDELLAELETIREQGYAHSSGEAAHGVQSIGLAFEGSSGVVHAVGVFRYSHSLGDSNLEDEPLPYLAVLVDDVTGPTERGGKY